MLVTELGIVIELRLEHQENAQLPMYMTDFGIVIEVSLEHL